MPARRRPLDLRRTDAAIAAADAAPDTEPWKVVEQNKENFCTASKETAALIGFDTCASLGPKIGLTRRDRLARADMMRIRVDPVARALIDADPVVGNYQYTEFPPHYYDCRRQ